MKRLVLMRGLPGSGKSTEARMLAVEAITAEEAFTVAICSTDNFHLVDGEYVFQPDKLHEFHQLNQALARQYMALDTNLVIIDNTNIKRKDMQPYIDTANQYGYEVEELIVGKDRIFPDLEDACPHKFQDYIDQCAARNTHGVPKDVIEKMARRFQE